VTTGAAPEIVQQIALAFGVEIDKDVVRPILSVHYGPDSGSQGPSWLTFLGRTKNSLWSCDLFRCESATFKTHWVLVVMDQFTPSDHRVRRAPWRSRRRGAVPDVSASDWRSNLSSDHDLLNRFHQWQANLRVLEVREIKTVPCVPLSHPFVERLIGTVRREYLDRTLSWTTADLETKLLDFQHYFNAHRTHAGLEGRLPEPSIPESASPIGFGSYRWQGTAEGCTRLPSLHD